MDAGGDSNERVWLLFLATVAPAERVGKKLLRGH